MFQLNNSKSIDGIFILSLVSSFLIILFSPSLKISKTTLLQAGHLILFTASNKFNHSKFSQLALIKISQDLKSEFFAGDHFIILSTFTQSICASTTAQIHSKSQDNDSLKLLFSSIFKYEECLSHNQVTNQLIDFSNNFSLLIIDESKYSLFIIS